MYIYSIYFCFGYVCLDMWFSVYEYIPLNAGRVAGFFFCLFFLPENLIQMGQDPNKHSRGATRQSVKLSDLLLDHKESKAESKHLIIASYQLDLVIKDLVEGENMIIY